MLNQELEAALNEQLGGELYSSHLYLSMSAYCESVNMPGAAHWFRMQADEERTHALKFFDHIVDRGGRVTLGVIEAPPTGFASLLDAFEQALQAERNVSAAIDRLASMAVAQGDHAAGAFLQWFVTEQVEEEKQADEVVQTLRAVGDDPTTLFILDRELAQRQPEAAEA
ncbi:MAG: ferritin [Actinobacteria bacterium RBG_19FT_COMBO_70_19]|jgi:ferritin|nr:MAG: ferritin [Actinobacteria bacterium RBG_19FT_COMBO_70_19]